MNKLTQFLLRIFSFLFTVEKPQIKPTPSKPNPVQGLFSIDVVAKKIVGGLFDNPMLIGALKGKVDLSKQFGLGFQCYLLPQSNQKFTISLVDGGIKLTFDDTCPKIYAEKFFSVECDIDFIYIERDKVRISLVGLPDFIIRFI